MHIDLLCPSRERINLNLTLISSLLTTADDIKNITLYFGLDTGVDKDPFYDVMKRIEKNSNFIKIIDIPNEGEFKGLGYLWNRIAECADGEIFGMIGNDMIFKTPGWDTEILKEFTGENLPDDKIKMVYCFDGHRINGEIAVNGFLHRKYYEINKYFMREEFRINWVDMWLHQIFDSFGRLKFRPDIQIFHNHWCYNQRPIDNTGLRMMKADEGKISDKLWDELGPERDKEAQRIAEHIGFQPDWSKIHNKFRK